MPNKIEKLQAQVITKLQARAEAALSVDNNSLHDKFQSEAKNFKLEYAQVLADNKIGAEFADTIAIYAMQKIRKILKSVATGKSALDKYTQAIIHNAKSRKQTIDNQQQNASLSSSIELASMKARDTRLHKAVSTASTQSSSTRKALTALNIASYDKESKSLHFNEESTMFGSLTK